MAFHNFFLKTIIQYKKRTKMNLKLIITVVVFSFSQFSYAQNANAFHKYIGEIEYLLCNDRFDWEHVDSTQFYLFSHEDNLSIAQDGHQLFLDDRLIEDSDTTSRKVVSALFRKWMSELVLGNVSAFVVNIELEIWFTKIRTAMLPGQSFEIMNKEGEYGFSIYYAPTESFVTITKIPEIEQEEEFLIAYIEKHDEDLHYRFAMRKEGGCLKDKKIFLNDILFLLKRDCLYRSYFRSVPSLNVD